MVKFFQKAKKCSIIHMAIKIKMIADEKKLDFLEVLC